VLCELFWVLSAAYKLRNHEILEKVEQLIKSRKVNIQEYEVEGGLHVARAGGDFSDGVKLYSGRSMTSSRVVFASFDRQAIRLLAEHGVTTLLPD